ncbi:MAG: porin [Balneola sp.]
MKYYSKLLLLLFALVALPQNSKSQNAEVKTLGKGIVFEPEDNSYSVKLGMRFQSLYVGEWNLENDVYSDQALIRRARLKLDGHIYSEKFTYKVQLGFSNRDTRNSSSGGIVQNSGTSNIVLDGVIKYNPVSDFEIWFGQTVLPGNRERLISSQKVQFVDRSLLNSSFNLDRDVGLQFRNKFSVGDAVLKQMGAVSIGEGRDITTKNPGGYSYTGRVEFLPFGNFKGKGDYTGPDLEREEDVKLSVGLIYDFNDGAVRSRGHTGGFVFTSGGDLVKNDLYTFLADAMLKYQGISVHGEFANRDADNDNGFGTGTAYMGSLGYVFGDNFGLSGRYATLTKTGNFSSLTEHSEMTLALSKYISGHNLKLQASAGYLDYVSRDDIMRFQIHMEIAF